MGTEAGHRVRLERVIRADREQVFRAWTEAGQMKRWFAPQGFTIPEAEVDPQPGGAFRVIMRAPDGSEHVARGTFRRVEPPALLTFTWAWESGAAEEPEETLVTVELSEEGSSTRVLLVHEGFSTEADRENHEEGWTSCVEQLVTLLEVA
ncbi:MAG TPA: SRPBCC domain-containing protein [Longimicrobiales bacterium]|nr:SRPBCC domain-containing protein [Longimicrobiales bacterium]